MKKEMSCHSGPCDHSLGHDPQGHTDTTKKRHIVTDSYSLNQYQDAPLERGDVLRFQLLAKYAYGSVLDVGCGTGDMANYMSDVVQEYVGLDTGGLIQVHGSLYQLPIKDSAFDTVILSEVLEHLEHPIYALKEIARVSKERILISVPNPWNMNQILSLIFQNHNIIEKKHISLFGDNEISVLCERAGINIIKKERFYLPIPRTQRYIPIRSRFGVWNIYVCNKKSS
ncbi:class I SAM-dependent methyltransferase [Methanofollis sp. UBA420]|jgi:SAM-dependent methyltransferase|uniref:class I SAM-dependent methyltransferase n=1 Tax=Methanofollis sp. UBA420 TaxID=1915514 RepID=UPI00316ADC63